MHFFFLTLECLDGISNQWCSAYFRFFWLQQAISKALCLNQKKKKKKERERKRKKERTDEPNKPTKYSGFSLHACKRMFWNGT